MSLTLLQKKSLRDYEPKRVQYLGELKAATGIDFEFVVEPSIEGFVAKLIAGHNGAVADKIGECLYGDNGYVAHSLKFFQKQWGDELVREALVGACSAKKIVLRDNDGWDPVEFAGGVMYLNTNVGQCWLYMDRIDNFDPSSKL